MRKPKDLVLRATLSAACALALSNCSPALPIAVSGACPSLPEYSKDVQNQAADELEKLPEGSIVGGLLIPDYGRMRDAVRECIKARNTK